MKIFTPKLINTSSQFIYLSKAFYLVWAAAPRWTQAWLCLLIIQGILPALTVYLTRAVVDSLVVAVNAQGDWVAIQPALWLVAVMVLLTIVSAILRSLTTWVTTGQSEIVQDYISSLIHHQASTLDLGFYETPEYYDQLERAQQDAASQPLAILKNLGALLQNGITLVIMAGVLLPLGIWIPLVLFGSTFPAFALILQQTRRHYAWRQRTTHDRRRTYYYDLLLTNRAAAAEMRLYDLGEHFSAVYQTIRRRLRGENLDLIRSRALAEFIGGSVALMGIGSAMAWMVWRTIQGNASLGDLALFYQAFHRGQSLASTSLSNLGDIYRNLLFLENLFDFLTLQPQIVDLVQPQSVPAVPQRGLALHHVTFCYPGSSQPALKNFNLQFQAGKITAIVGANGAGKSTLVKLLARFYEPQAGVVTLDGIDLRNFNQKELRRHITIMFQNPMQYATTAAENIALGDFTPAPTQTRIMDAAMAAGADEAIQRLPDGYDNMLGRWFGGAELSVGEWQRLAQARAFLRQAPIVILDEPTSAMDSWAEAEWLARFRKLVAGRIAIIITHRFTTAMHADIIHVMDGGQVIESGTHEELCASGGRYAESWRKQMQTARTSTYARSNGHPVAA